MDEGLSTLLEELRSQGRPDSSGTFTLDLSRLLPTLGRYQLPHPDRCVLRLLAAAVAGQAATFQYLPCPGGYVVKFDGRPLSAVDLDRLFMCLLSPNEPWLSELAVAVNAARAHGARVILESPAGGRLTVEGTQLGREPCRSGLDATRVEIVWSGLSRWLDRSLRSAIGRAEHDLLEERGAWAPLELHLPAPVKRRLPTCATLIRVGRPPEFPNARVDRVLDWGLEGSGYLLLGTSSPCSVIIHGVRYPMGKSRIPHTAILWWTGQLALDLSRESPVAGLEWQGLWAELEVQLLEAILPTFDREGPWGAWLTRQVAGLSEQSRDRFSQRLRQAPLFPRADGSLGSLAQLQEQYDRDGYLPVSTVPFLPHAWEPSKVVLQTSTFNGLGQRFPHQIPVGHLARRLDSPRLPPEEAYLTRVPLCHLAGEMGLRAGGHQPRLRVAGVDPAWTVLENALHALDAALPPGLNADQVTAGIPELYLALFNQRHPEAQQALVSAHLLDFLAGASHSIKQAKLAGLIHTRKRIRWRGARQIWRGPQFRQVAQGIRFPTVEGEWVALLDLLSGPPRLYVGPDWNRADPPPPGTLVLTVQTATRVEALLKPRPALDNYSSALNLTSQARAALRGPGGQEPERYLLYALRGQPQSSAGQILRPYAWALANPPAGQPSLSLNELSRRAGEIAGKAGSPVASEHLLLALLQAPSGWAAQALGASREAVEAEVCRRRGREALAYLDQLLEKQPLPAFRLRRAGCLMRQGRAPEALADCRQALLEGGVSAYRLSYLARAQALAGQLEEALETYLRCLPLAGSLSPVMQANLQARRSEVLCRLERLQEAEEACEQALKVARTGQALATRARICLARGDLAQALNWARRATATSRYPASAHETQALALESIGQFQPAAEAYLRFVQEVDGYGLEEPKGPERLEEARKRIRELQP